jgi:(2Fe-2S) ferredoxin
VDLKGEALACDDLLDAGPSLSDVETPSLSTEIDGRLRTIPHVDDAKGGGQVGIFRISHLGGHRYAGVMIICFPSGAQLYYGRVSPHEIEKVVEETILGGQVLAGLLRAGGNVLRERSSVDGKPCENRSILSW